MRKRRARAKECRRNSGAIYTTGALCIIIPVVTSALMLFLEIGYNQYAANRLSFVISDVFEQIDGVEPVNENTLRPLIEGSACANGIKLQNLKLRVNSKGDLIQIECSGLLGQPGNSIISARQFKNTYSFSATNHELAYLAINSYPFCESDPARGLSAYMPIMRPRTEASTWVFNQDTAIESAHKSATAKATGEEEITSNWWRSKSGDLSIY